ncbi:MAG TPA: NAD-dependent epimerase/dehydratase family protein, partial [Actinobacteria bacterium]|nr:NAD-dependent epimerase/dehydratase family protein [Actinomycetes bacterium]HEX21097.1 NAD-dependent epimerase/dehydratase family protein [Actinomycetota bacterium]
MRVLITGITGFAGSHLAELSLRKGAEVWGIKRWRSRMDNIEHIVDKLKLVEGDIRDATSMRSIIEESAPDYIFHLAAQSFVPTSWKAPTDTLDTNIIGQLNIFEAMRQLDLDCP